MKDVKRGFWDETFDARVLGVPPLSAEDEYLQEPDPGPVCAHDALYEAMNQLTARQAFVVRLHYGLGDAGAMTQQEVADIAGWSLPTVQEHLFRAEQKLHKILTGKVRKNPL